MELSRLIWVTRTPRTTPENKIAKKYSEIGDAPKKPTTAARKTSNCTRDCGLKPIEFSAPKILHPPIRASSQGIKLTLTNRTPRRRLSGNTCEKTVKPTWETIEMLERPVKTCCTRSGTSTGLMKMPPNERVTPTLGIWFISYLFCPGIEFVLIPGYVTNIIMNELIIPKIYLEHIMHDCRNLLHFKSPRPFWQKLISKSKMVIFKKMQKNQRKRGKCGLVVLG